MPPNDGPLLEEEIRAVARRHLDLEREEDKTEFLARCHLQVVEKLELLDQRIEDLARQNEELRRRVAQLERGRDLR